MHKPNVTTFRLLLLIALACFASACNRKDSTPAADSATGKPAAADAAGSRKTPPELKLREINLVRDQDGKLLAKGAVDNSATRPLNKVEATVKIYDEKGVEIATLKPKVDQLLPRYSWSFTIPVPQPNAAKAVVVEFTSE